GGGQDTPRRTGDGQGHQGPPFGTGSARRAEGSRDREPGRCRLDDRRRPGAPSRRPRRDGGMTARPWVFGLADLTVGLPLRVSAGLRTGLPPRTGYSIV